MDGWSPLDSPRVPIIPAESSPKDDTPPRLAGGEPIGLFISPGGFGTCARAPNPSPSETSNEATRVSLHHGFASSRLRQCAPLAPFNSPKPVAPRSVSIRKSPASWTFFSLVCVGPMVPKRFSVTLRKRKRESDFPRHRFLPEQRSDWYRRQNDDIITTVNFRVSLERNSRSERHASFSPLAGEKRRRLPLPVILHDAALHARRP